MSALVSIITPTYNHERYIGACIESVLSQTFTNWEMLIIDDGSTDKTYSIAKSYAGDKRVKVFTQKNIGVFRLGETYNFALGLAEGEYIAILEGDDLWEANKLERQASAMENDKGIVLAWSRAKAINEDNTKVIAVSPPEDYMAYKDLFFNDPVGSIFNILYKKDFINAMTIVLRKDILLKIGGFIHKGNMPFVDYTTLLGTASLGKFHYDEAVLGAWRSYPNQVTKTYAVNIYEALNIYIVEHFDHLAPEIKDKLTIERKDIIKHWNEQLLISYARSGRYKLLKENYKEARKDYMKAIFFKGLYAPSWRVRAAIGLVFSFFHINVEGLAKLTGRRAYSAKK